MLSNELASAASDDNTEISPQTLHMYTKLICYIHKSIKVTRQHHTQATSYIHIPYRGKLWQGETLVNLVNGHEFA